MEATWNTIADPQKFVINTLAIESPYTPKWLIERESWVCEQIGIENLTVDRELLHTNEESPMYLTNVGHFMSSIKENIPIPPLIALGRKKFLLDGYARFIALKKCGANNASVIFQKFNSKFDTAEEFLGNEVEIIFDRPLGSRHPKYGFTYQLNYGFIPGTLMPDLEELDAYFLGEDKKPLAKISGKCVAIIKRVNDNDDKLVVVPESFPQISIHTIEEKINFQEQWFTHKIINK